MAEPPNGQSKLTVLPTPALATVGAPGATSIADVTERVLPSVVNISLTKLMKMQGPQGPFPFFFGPQEGGERREQGMGSGVVISSDGYVITNNHVVEDAQEIKVTLYDKREFDAEVVGTDPKSDVAVIRLKGAPNDLRPIAIDDSAKLRLGDVVLAIGNPFGVGQTVTMGIVSAKGRADVGIVDYEDFIQTDAAINPGNSGGALVDMEGKLVGINTAILSRSGGYQGIGFAIPTNMAMPILESLKKYGKVTRGWLGVSIQDVDQELSQTMKLPTARGVLIADVQAGSPAAKAGIQRGDVVEKVQGHDVSTTGEFRNAIAAAGAGRKVDLELYRDGKLRTIPAALGEMTADNNNPSGAPSARPAERGLDGITLSDLSPEARHAFGINDAGIKGVVVTQLAPGSPAARAGLRPGDVLMEVNRKPVANVREFQETYGKARGNVLLLLHRRGTTVFVVVKR
ncbi:MAG TPA: DegQ family serine endoprotease [Polyangiaceae bacterium]|nr:DegQ family serine endoprotease [Polyangiaceae bacterium]